MLEKIKFQNFTAFADLEVQFSKGINIFVGENGADKTHLMKAAYAACSFPDEEKTFPEKVLGVFRPRWNHLGRLVKRVQGRKKGSLKVTRRLEGDSISIQLAFSTASKKPAKVRVSGAIECWKENPLEAVYIPAKEFLSHAPGFLSLAAYRHVHFEDVYEDMLKKANLPPLRGPTDKKRKRNSATFMSGKVVSKGEEFFLRDRRGFLEFTLLAEGHKKIALLWLLVKNGTLNENSVLFWDEPEANLNPKLMGPVVKALLELQRMGAQVFVATHEYVILREFDLRSKKTDKVKFHSLYRDNDGSQNIQVRETDNYLFLDPNAISATFEDMIDRGISRSMGKIGKCQLKRMVFALISWARNARLILIKVTVYQ